MPERRAERADLLLRGGTGAGVACVHRRETENRAGRISGIHIPRGGQQKGNSQPRDGDVCESAFRRGLLKARPQPHGGYFRRAARAAKARPVGRYDVWQRRGAQGTACVDHHHRRGRPGQKKHWLGKTRLCGQGFARGNRRSDVVCAHIRRAGGCGHIRRARLVRLQSLAGRDNRHRERAQRGAGGEKQRERGKIVPLVAAQPVGCTQTGELVAADAVGQDGAGLDARRHARAALLCGAGFIERGRFDGHGIAISAGKQRRIVEILSGRLDTGGEHAGARSARPCAICQLGKTWICASHARGERGLWVYRRTLGQADARLPSGVHMRGQMAHRIPGGADGRGGGGKENHHHTADH